MHSQLNWDDLRLVLAIARQGTLSGAARALGVTHSTVFRRLGAIEQGMGVRLFDRFRNGYAATPAGESAANLAARFEHDLLEIERRISGQDTRPSGIVRIATTDTVAVILMPHLAALRAAHPQIELEITISNTMANLTRREADIALRPTPEPPEILVGRRISDVAHAIYGAPAYLSRAGNRDLDAYDWIGLDDALAATVIGQWARKRVPDRCVACRVDALHALRDAACAGMGLVVLPCYVGDLADGLCRAVPTVLPELRSALWLLTHEDLRRTARVRAVMEFLAKGLAGERALLEGKRPITPPSPRPPSAPPRSPSASAASAAVQAPSPPTPRRPAAPN